MAVVTLQLGQCGNQLGEEFFEALRTEATHARPALAAALGRIYFSADSSPRRASAAGAPWRPRAVLVDTEPRVVQRCLDGSCSRRGDWRYDAASAVWRQGGAANNWACGFRHYGPALAEPVLDCVRREAEACDRLEGFLAFHSVAGGTGSGLGSYMIQSLREEFPETTIASLSIWPFEGGEVSVQSYNAALSMAALYQSVDMVLLCENERYLDICRRALQEPQPSLQSINAAIAEGALRALLPCRSAVSPGGLGCPLLRLRGQLCSHPLYRLLTLRSLPQISQGARAFGSDCWSALQRRMVQLCEAGSVVDMPGLGSTAAPGSEDAAAVSCPRPCRSVGAAAFLWGLGAVEAPIDALLRLPVWRLALDPLQVHADPQQVASLERSLGLVSNCQTVVPMLARAGLKATAMLRASAYVHQYERFGLGREEMSEALLALLQMRHDYEQL